MRESLKAVLAHHGVRKTMKQKQDFRQWLQRHGKSNDYQLSIQNFKNGRGKNIIVGNPMTAKVILTAHYDTPPDAILPVMTIIGSIPMYLISQLFIFLPVIGIFTALFFLGQWIFGPNALIGTRVPFFGVYMPLAVFIMLIIWSLQMMFGAANKNNANDNTSGVGVLLYLLESLPKNKREQICFVFFDEEEKGLEGAKAFRKKFESHLLNIPLINFDCVGNGTHPLFITKKRFRESSDYKTLEGAVSLEGEIKKAKYYVYPSDQIIFKNSVGVTVVHKCPLLGYYLTRLHSRFDTKINEVLIEKLAEITARFIEGVIEEKNDEKKCQSGEL